MKKISLPGTNTVSFTLPPIDQSYNGILMPDGNLHISIGNLDSKHFDALETARLNGGTILWATSCVEKILDNIIVNYFLGPFSGPSTKRELFESELIKTSFFQFNTKKHLVEKISRFYLTGKSKGNDKNKLQNNLKSIMDWRNAFAHGTLILDSKSGVLLRYYSGAQKEETLNDQFWETVEFVFKNCNELLKDIEHISAKD
jgi:hypothetical protein